ncbi:hypothetical protein AGMMS49940_00290 [Spirochaetia bacterium]|nr:hypothetical protein AGMMS49940_00290 [Spirochaetia bacterium]
MRVKEVLSKLYADGWYELKGKGTSHIQLKHPSKSGRRYCPFYLKKHRKTGRYTILGGIRNEKTDVLRGI